MTKKSIFNHNNKSVCVSDFAFDGVTASGYVHGRFVSGDVGDYKYPVKKINGKVTSVSNAKHYLVDLHNMTYGNTTLSKSEAGKLSHSRIRVKHTRVERLNDGRCKATGIINGTLVTIYYDGYVESNYTGELKEAKPWLKDVREDLEFKYKFEMKKMADPAIEELKALHKKDAQMVVELLREAGLVA